MKKIFFLSLCYFFANSAVFAQLDFGLSYGYSRPGGKMADNIKGVHGLNLSMGYNLPKTPFMIGLDLGFGGYGYETQRQTYTFADGSTTETNVNVSNNVFNLMLVGRVYYPNQTVVQPYLQFRGGLSDFYTNLTIEDPTDVDDCHPLESDILKSSSNIAGSIGVGARIYLSKNDRRTMAIDIGANYVNGGRVSYMSLNKATPQSNPVSDVSAEFINTTHQVRHKHHVGYIYETPINLIDWRVGVSMQF